MAWIKSLQNKFNNNWVFLVIVALLWWNSRASVSSQTTGNQEGHTPDIIKSRGFILVDEDGHEHGGLFLGKGGASLLLKDPQGRTIAAISQINGTNAFSIVTKNGDNALAIEASTDATTLAIISGEDESIKLTATKKAGATALGLESGTVGKILAGTFLDANPPANLALMGNNSDPAVTMSVQKLGGLLSIERTPDKHSSKKIPAVLMGVNPEGKKGFVHAYRVNGAWSGVDP